MYITRPLPRALPRAPPRAPPRALGISARISGGIIRLFSTILSGTRSVPYGQDYLTSARVLLRSNPNSVLHIGQT